MNKYLKNILFVIFSFTIGISILYYIYHNFNADYIEQCKQDGIALSQCSLKDKLFDDFRSVNIFWLLVVLSCYTLSNVSRAIRWRMLLKSLGYTPKLSNSFFAVMINYFTNLFIPRMGEFTRAAVMTKFEKIPMEKGMGTVVVGRVIDVISLLLFISIAFLLEYDTLWNWLVEELKNDDGKTSSVNILLYVLAGLFFLSVILFFIFKKQIQNSFIYKKIVTILMGFWEGILSIGKLEKPVTFIFHSMVIWMMYFLMNYFCFKAFVPTEDLTMTVGLMVFVFGAFGIVIPSPGGMGSYHYLVIAALGLYGINKFDAFSFANIAFFSIQIFCNFLMGISSVILLFLLNKNYNPTPSSISSTVNETESVL